MIFLFFASIEGALLNNKPVESVQVSFNATKAVNVIGLGFIFYRSVKALHGY